MNENPFEHSTMTSTPLANTMSAAGDGVEVRYPESIRTLVPGVLLASAVTMPIVMFFALPTPQNILVAAAVAVMEFPTAGFLWFLFNATVMRADSNGVTKVQFGKAQTVRWDQIANMEMRQVGNGAMQIILKDSGDKILIQLSDCGNRRDGDRLIEYIENQLAE